MNKSWPSFSLERCTTETYCLLHCPKISKSKSIHSISLVMTAENLILCKLLWNYYKASTIIRYTLTVRFPVNLGIKYLKFLWRSCSFVSFLTILWQWNRNEEEITIYCRRNSRPRRIWTQLPNMGFEEFKNLLREVKISSHVGSHNCKLLVSLELPRKILRKVKKHIEMENVFTAEIVHEELHVLQDKFI